MMTAVKEPFIIAELGAAHGGGIAKAKELVDAAFTGLFRVLSAEITSVIRQACLCPFAV
ncbi:MAG: hypothetical protein LBG27_08975 [Spirochaetaceae bacterium]|jgi:hypothetical protein|nr:hypothetical protein [Spirochaetaceae bacterium]